MNVSAKFEDGKLSLTLVAETDAEQRMIGAVINQPQDEQGCAYLDKSLISAVLRYEGHFTNKRIASVTLSVYKPNPVETARAA